MIAVAAKGWTSKAEARQPGAPLISVGMLILAACVQSLWIPVDADVSWLITVSEAVLSGQRLYVDLIEVNPPASVWLYLPWVWLAQLLDVRPEPIVIAAALGGAWVSLQATLRIARSLRHPPPTPLLLSMAASFALFALPGGLFAQREHVALMLALPLVTQLAVLAQRRTLTGPATVWNGLAAGALVVIKPHFAAALALPAIWTALQLRDVRPLLWPVLVAITTAGAYAAAVLLFAPAYLDLLPMLADTYLPMRDQPLNFLIGPLLLVPAIFFVLSRLTETARQRLLPTLLFLAAAGFVIAGLVQGKNYLNHALPGMALSFIGLVLIVSEDGKSARRRAVALAAAAVLAMQTHATHSILPPPGLVAAIQQAAPEGSTVMTLGSELGTGHPATRLAGARWVGSRPSLFTAAGARYVGLTDPVIRRWYEADLAAFAADVGRHGPVLLLVEDRSKGWLLAEPLIQNVVASYRPVMKAGRVEVWRRR